MLPAAELSNLIVENVFYKYFYKCFYECFYKCIVEERVMGLNEEKTYYSDATHNYLVLACPQEVKNNYQYKMLAANQIRGLLPCSGRSIDNREYLYYDITSRQSLSDLYDRRTLRCSDLQRILEDIFRVEKTLTEYLLDGSHIITDPECIYADFREQECSFVYYPGEIQEGGWEPLFTFLSDRVDGRDKRAAALSYRLCMMAEKPGFRLREDILEELGIHPVESRGSVHAQVPVFAEKRSGASLPDMNHEGILPETTWDYRDSGRQVRKDTGSIERKDSLKNSTCHETSPNGARKARKTGTAREADKNESDYIEYSREREIPELEQEQAAVGNKMERRTKQPSGGRGKRNRKIRYISALILILAGSALLLLDRFCPLQEREMILSRAFGGVLAAAGGILGAVGLIQERRKKIQAADIKTDYEETVFSGDNLAWRDADSLCYYDEKTQNPTARGRMQADVLQGEVERQGGNEGLLPPREPAAFGETCLLRPEEKKPCGLYGIGTCRGEKISLEDLPCVVGKIGEYVDQVLDDSSVSRMHARFALDREGRMTIRDLNSTNGTWLNGERLLPNECRALQEGDHVRLGRMQFVYR